MAGVASATAIGFRARPISTARAKAMRRPSSRWRRLRPNPARKTVQRDLAQRSVEPKVPRNGVALEGVIEIDEDVDPADILSQLNHK